MIFNVLIHVVVVVTSGVFRREQRKTIVIEFDTYGNNSSDTEVYVTAAVGLWPTFVVPNVCGPCTIPRKLSRTVPGKGSKAIPTKRLIQTSRQIYKY